MGGGLAWRVGKGTKFRIGLEPWPGSGKIHLLPHPLIDALHERGYLYLAQITYMERTTIWGQSWK